MVSYGATVILACRNRSRAEAARVQMLRELHNSSAPHSLLKAQSFQVTTGKEIENKEKRGSENAASSPNSQPEALLTLEERLLVRKLDLSRLKSVRACVAELEKEGLAERIDLLILNAGVSGM